MSNSGYIFGPVPSRRLGRSLGINAVPKKVCSLDCLYCEVGATNRLTLERKEYIKSEDIIAEFKKIYPSIKNSIDVITVTGAGEPTLNSALVSILNGIRNIVNGEKEIAILTNTTLITNDDVYNTLLGFDIVVPSLDAITADIFQKIDKPHEDINTDKMIKRLKQFSDEYKGKLYLEILFVKGINDSNAELENLAKHISQIKYNKLQLNTVYRPPAYSEAKALSEVEMSAIEQFFEDKKLPLDKGSEFHTDSKIGVEDNTKRIETFLEMRPATKDDILSLYDINKDELDKIISCLVKTGNVITTRHGEKLFFHHKRLRLDI